MDVLIARSTFMTLRWTLWHTLTSSLVDHLVVSYSQKKVKGKCCCIFFLWRHFSFGWFMLQHAICFRLQFEKTDYSSRCPISQFWDENEPRLFVCETVPISSESSSKSCFLETVKLLFNFKVVLYSSQWEWLLFFFSSDRCISSDAFLYSRAWAPPTGLLP